MARFMLPAPVARQLGELPSLRDFAAPSHTTLLIQSDRIDVGSPKEGMRNQLGRYLMPSQAA
jgi:hypothetical protein